MGKRTPRERWDKHVEERVIAFRNSNEFRRLRRRGLSVIGRTRLLNVLEYWQGWSQWMSLSEFVKWREKTQAVGEIFGLAQWTVELLCLLKNYRPDQSSLVAEVIWPRIRVVTGVEDTLFQKWLCYHAWTLGLKVIFKKGPVETVLLWLDFAIQPQDELPVSSLPPQHTAFLMRVETPTLFPPEARTELENEAANLERKLLRDLGYINVPRRLRSSPLVKKASQLRASTDRLPRRGLYKIAPETSGDDFATVEEDKQLVKTLKTQRHRVRKRLGRYTKDDG